MKNWSHLGPEACVSLGCVVVVRPEVDHEYIGYAGGVEIGNGSLQPDTFGKTWQYKQNGNEERGTDILAKP